MQRFVRQVASLAAQTQTQTQTQTRPNSRISPCLPRGPHSGHFIFTSANSLARVPRFTPSLLRPQFQRHSNSFRSNPSFPHYTAPWRSWLRGLSPNDVVLALIVANVAVFLSWRLASEKFMSDNFTISLHNLRCGRLHTLITNAFSHIDEGHIISNMIGLYFFGTSIGRNFGSEYLLKLYLAGALGGSVFYLAHQSYKALTSQGWKRLEVSKHQALGASGAVNAIMLLNIFLFPRATLYFNFIIPVPAILMGIFLIGNDMLKILEGDSRISGSAHLGGAAVAALAWARVRRGRF